MPRNLIGGILILFLLLPISSCGPGNPSVLKAMEPVVVGQGVANAAEYDPNRPGLHRLVVLNTSGAPHEWNDDLPPEWIPSSVDKTELVVVIHPEREVDLGSQTYVNQAGQEVEVHRIRYEMDVDAREARTGNVLWTYTLRGTDPGPFPYELRGNVGLRGEPVTPTALETLLKCRIQQDKCKVLQSEDIIDFALAPDGTIIALGLRDGTIQLRIIDEGILLDTLEGHQQAVNSLAFSPDGTLLASGDIRGDTGAVTVRLWRTSDGKLVRSEELYSAYFVNSLTFSPDGLFLAVFSAGGPDNVLLWDISDGETIYPRCISVMGVATATYLPDGTLLTFESYQRNRSDYSHIALWSVSNDSCTLLRDEEVWQGYSSISLSPDGKLLAMGSYSGGVLITRLRNWENAYSLRDPPPFTFDRSPVNSLDFSSDGSFLVSGLNVYAQIWRLNTQGYLVEEASQTLEFPGNVVKVAFSPQGSSLILLLEDGTLWIWDIGVTGP